MKKFIILYLLFLTACHLDKLVDLNCANPPIAAFKADTTTCEIPCAIQFTNLSQEATSYKWIFNNGSTSESQTPPLQNYLESGSYSVLLIAGNGANCSDTAELQINVTKPTDYQMVIASFTANTLFCKAPCTISFTNNSSNATDYLWDFGDGTPKVTPPNPASISHTFQCSGVYNVVLNASNPKWTALDTIQVRITTDNFNKNIKYQGVETRAKVARPTPDGGFIVAGTIREEDAWLAKIDALGNTIWANNYTGDRFDDVQILPDGSYVAIGAEGGLFDSKALLAKIDANGIVQGTIKPLDIPTDSEYCNSFVLAPNGDCIIAGVSGTSTTSPMDFLVAKVNAQGDYIWSKNFGNSQAIRFKTKIIRASSGEYIFAGTWFNGGPSGYRDIVICSISDIGQINWTKTLGKPNTQNEVADIKELPTGGFVLVGYTRASGDEDIYLVKTDAMGNQVDDYILIDANTKSYPAGIEVLPDDTYIIAGDNSPMTGISQTFLAKVKWKSSPTWTRQFNTIGEIYPNSLVKVPKDCGYIMGGSWNNTDALLIKTDADGKL
jgi:PKD repeat protein